jgi:hypothetical protein
MATIKLDLRTIREDEVPRGNGQTRNDVQIDRHTFTLDEADWIPILSMISKANKEQGKTKHDKHGRLT